MPKIIVTEVVEEKKTERTPIQRIWWRVMHAMTTRESWTRITAWRYSRYCRPELSVGEEIIKAIWDAIEPASRD
ncbi:MAG: hypothetical protein WC919_01465 [Candidatus Paceibacterota bacterium]|jgi:hypothetical protein